MLQATASLAFDDSSRINPESSWQSVREGWLLQQH
jgi:hypothetical protein